MNRFRLQLGRWHILPVCAALAVLGCSETATDTATQRPRVALIMKSLANEFFSTMAEGAEAHQKQHSDEYDLIVNGIKDERDLSRQVALVDEMIAQQVDAIVIAPADSKALVPALKKALAQGIVVINIDNRLDRSVLAEAGISVPFVGPDNRAGARKVAEHLAGQLQKGAPVAILEGIPTAENAQQRKAGFEDAMNDAGMKIVTSQSAQWEMSIADTVASAMLTEHDDLQAILCANDSMALGALAAVKTAGLQEQVRIVGFDNISAVQEAVRSGQILATADQHGDQLAVFGIEAALEHLKSGSPQENRETPVDLITAEQLQ